MRRNGCAAALLAAVLGVSACSSGGDGSNDSADAADQEQPADCDPARPGGAIEGPQALSFDGEERAYLLALPEAYDGTTATPLLFSFHGFASNKEGQEAYTALAEKGTARGYIVVTPDAVGDPREWNFFADQAKTDDFGLIDALIADLGEQLCIDPARVYAAGHSAGSAFTGFLACQVPDRFAAVAMVAAFIPTTCAIEEGAPSVVAFHGTADPAVPYEGGPVADGPVGIPAVLETLDQYADEYRCEQPATQDEPAAGVLRHTLTGCAHDSEVVLHTIVDGSHGWPGNALGVGTAEVEGEQFPATDVILDFFDEHRL